MPHSPLTQRPRHRRTFWASASGIVAVLAACAPIGDPDLGTGTETTVVAATPENDNGTADVSSVDEEAESVDVEAPLQVFSPPRPSGYVPSLLLIDDVGLSVLDSTEAGFGERSELSVVLGGEALAVVDDYFGGLVVEQLTEEDASTVVWLRGDGSPPAPIATVGERLLDVGFIDSTIQAHALVETTPQLIERIPLGEGERAILVELDESQSLIDLSASEGLFALSVADANCGALIFLDSSGTEVPVGGPGTPPCAVGRRPAYGPIALSPDATRIAYTTRTYRSDGVVATTDLIVLEFGTDVELFSRTIGGAGENVDHLAFDGFRLVFTRQQTELTQIVELTIESEAEEQLVLESPEQSGVVFARQPVTVGR